VEHFDFVVRGVRYSPLVSINNMSSLRLHL
jgi:hypothetical protein